MKLELDAKPKAEFERVEKILLGVLGGFWVLSLAGTGWAVYYEEWALGAVCFTTAVSSASPVILVGSNKI